MRKIMDKVEFDKWVNYQLTELIVRHHFNLFNKEVNQYSDTYFIIGDIAFSYLSDRRTIRITNIFTGKSGWSTRHNEDEFDIEIGIAIAYARLKNEEIPIVENMVKIFTVAHGTTVMFNNKIYTNMGYINDKTPYYLLFRGFSDICYLRVEDKVIIKS